MARPIPGFDYTLTEDKKQVGLLKLSRSQWRKRIHDGIAHGGFRRVSHDETFLHDKYGLIVFEVYSNIPG